MKQMNDSMTKLCQVKNKWNRIRLVKVDIMPNSTVRRNLNATEILRCLKAGAYVTEIRPDGTTINLNFDNFLNIIEDDVKKVVDPTVEETTEEDTQVDPLDLIED